MKAIKGNIAKHILKNKEMGAEVVKHISEGIKSGKESPALTVEDRGYKIERAKIS